MADLRVRVGGRGRSEIMPPAVGGGIVGTTGDWADITDPLMNLAADAGTNAVVVDPDDNSNVYVNCDGDGIYKSTDWGNPGTWFKVSNHVGLLSMASGNRLYSGDINGPYIGFWLSLDGGVNWTNYNIAGLPSGRQDVYHPSIDPYDPLHLLIVGHEQDYLGESFDGGLNWSTRSLNGGMLTGGGTSFCFFIDTGSAGTTATRWLWCAQGTGGSVGTWLTTNASSSWTKVDSNEHPHGNMQIWQPSANIVFIGGIYGSTQGILRSTDGGATFSGVGNSGYQSGTIIGTPNNIYSFYGIGGASPAYQTAPTPGITGWTQPSFIFSNGPAQMAVAYDGIRRRIFGACWGQGLAAKIEA